MYRITFRGVKTERVAYGAPGVAPSIKRALEARGYTTEVGKEENPWQEDPSREEMVAVKGRLAKEQATGLLFLADTEEVMDTVWEAIHFYFPEAVSVPMETVKRPA